jgi:hypothetical protein
MREYCNPNDKPERTITINLRGTLFVTNSNIFTSLPRLPKNKFKKYEHYGENSSKKLNEDDWGFNAPPDERCYGYFIDRDPTHFHHILNFISYNIIPQQLREHDKLQLLEEAKYYELTELVTALTNDVSEQARPASTSWIPYSTKKTQKTQSVNLGGGRKKSRRRRNNRKSTRRRRHRKY